MFLFPSFTQKILILIINGFCKYMASCENIWTHTPTTIGSYDRQASRLSNENIRKSFYRLHFLYVIMLLQTNDSS